MKTNKEMAESVLERASAIKEKQKVARHWTSGVLAGAICLILILGLAAAPWNPKTPTPTGGQLVAPPTQVTEPTHPKESQPKVTQPNEEKIPVYSGDVYFVDGNDDAQIPEAMITDMTIATKDLIRVRNLNGLSPEEKYKVHMEEIAYREAFEEEYGVKGDGGRYELLKTENVIIHHLSGGHTSIILPDYNLIEGYTIQTTGVIDAGEATGWYYGDVTYGEGEDAVTIPAGSYRIFTNIRMSNETSNLFSTKPDTPLSIIRDTISVNIRFKDGSKAVVLLDVSVNDSGQVFVTMRGNAAL